MQNSLLIHVYVNRVDSKKYLHHSAFRLELDRTEKFEGQDRVKIMFKEDVIGEYFFHGNKPGLTEFISDCTGTPYFNRHFMEIFRTMLGFVKTKMKNKETRAFYLEALTEFLY